MAYLYVGLLGACVGSFLNVVIHRLPRQVSLIHPRSQCPWCGTQLPWHQIVPLWSYLWLRGRCASCRVSIPCSYPLIEIGTALLYAGLFHVFDWSWLLLRYGALAALLLAAAEIDRRHGIIPNRLVGIGVAIGLVVGTVVDVAALIPLVSAALASAVLLLLIRRGSRLVFGRPGLGMGDVKLAAMMGLFLGWENLWVFYLAVICGSVLGSLGVLMGRLDRTASLPFAPFLALGTGLHVSFLPPSLVLPC